MGQFFYFKNKLRHPVVIYPRTCRGFSRGCCYVAGSNIEEKSYVRKLFTSGWYRVNLRVSQTMLNHQPKLVFGSFCLLGEFAKGLTRRSSSFA